MGGSLAVQSDMRVVFSGKAVSESAVLDVLDRLKARPGVSDVKPLYLRLVSADRRDRARRTVLPARSSPPAAGHRLSPPVRANSDLGIALPHLP